MAILAICIFGFDGSNSVIQVLRYVGPFAKCLTKEKIREAMSLQEQEYRNGGKEENFRFSILLNNAMNNLNKNDSETALSNINEIRQNLCKRKIPYKS
jgi:hypothetical protein